MGKLCKCGCCQVVKTGNEFINGYNGRNEKRSPEIINQRFK